jgi:1,4-dihydroxy-6-naphthoate synthase
MFHALANGKFDTGPYIFRHTLQDIETLNRRALKAELELTAVSLHGYAHMTDTYALCSCGASMGDGYGPMVVAREPWTIDDLRGKRIAVPGELTTAFLTLKLLLGDDFTHEVHPFDEILNIVEAGGADAGLIIHEGQLTYAEQGLQLIVDLGRWWMDETGLPLPLGANAIRKDLGREAMEEVTALLKRSIRYGPKHWTMPCGTAAISTAERRTNSSACTSTTGRWISASAAAKPSRRCCDADMKPE